MAPSPEMIEATRQAARAYLEHLENQGVLV